MVNITVRILFIGFGDEIPNKETDEYIENIKIQYDSNKKEYMLSKKIPTIYDYHIVFLNNPFFCFNEEAPDNQDHGIVNTITEKIGEIKTLIEGGYVLVTILSKKYEKEYYYSTYSKTKFNNYEWNPFPIEIINKAGIEFAVEDTIFSKILNKDFFEWKAHYMHKFTPSNIIPLAKNIPGFPISIIQEINLGKIIYLPYYNISFQKDLFRSLIDIIKTKILTKDEKNASITPDWLGSSKYFLTNEEELIKQKNKIEEELKMSNTAKKILYESGKELSKSVSYILKQLHFKEVKFLEQEESDIQILDENIFFVIEVKGKKESADLDDLRQLLDWYIREQSKDETKEVKGIFIVNHYKDKDINDRKDPFTKKAIEFASNNNFVLITTSELFNIFKDYKVQKISKKEIFDLLNGKGLLNYKSK